MRLTVHAFLTMDGVMQAPGGAEEDPSDGFEHGGWMVRYADEAFGGIVTSWFDRTSAILVGRRTFEVMKPYWSQVTDPDNLAATKLNQGPKFVASSTLTDPDWGNTTVLSGDVLAQVAKLKQTGSDDEELQVHGSARLAQSLHEAGLVDEYRLITFPVTVGRGRRLFTEQAPATGFTVRTTTTTSTGGVYAELTPQAFQAGVFEVIDGKESV